MRVDQAQPRGDCDATTKCAPSAAAPDGMQVWLGLTAPGMLVTRAVVLLAIILTPLLTAAVHVDAVARAIAAALLLGHIASTLRLLQRPGWWSTTIFLMFLCADGVLAGVVVGADPQWRGPSVPIVAVVLALGFETGGWPGLGWGLAAVVVGVGAAAWSGVGTPLAFSPGVVFYTTLGAETLFGGVTTAAAAPLCATVLSVEPSFAGALAVDASACAPATVLTIEGLFAGVPAIGSTAALFVPTLLLVFGAIGIGGAVSLLRVRGGRPVATRVVTPS